MEFTREEVLSYLGAENSTKRVLMKEDAADYLIMVKAKMKSNLAKMKDANEVKAVLTEERSIYRSVVKDYTNEETLNILTF